MGIEAVAPWTVSADVIAPTLDVKFPPDDGTAFDDVVIVGTFSEPIQAGTGNIVVGVVGGAVVETFNIATGVGDDGGTVEIDNVELIVTLGNPPLNLGSQHYVKIAGTAIDDLSGNSYAGITNETDWAFLIVEEHAAPGGFEMLAADDSGLSNSDLVTNVTTNLRFRVFDLEGVIQDLDQLHVLLDDGQAVTPFDVGEFEEHEITVTFPGPLAQGTHAASSYIVRNGVAGASVGLTVVIDTAGPTVVGAPAITSSPASGDTYAEDENINLRVTWNEAAYVTGSPRLTIMIGAFPVIAAYLSGSGTTLWNFRYTVQGGDVDTNGISVSANQLALNGGTIKDSAGNNATLTHSALTDQSGHKVSAPVATREFSVAGGWHGSIYVNSGGAREYAAARAYILEGVL